MKRTIKQIDNEKKVLTVLMATAEHFSKILVVTDFRRFGMMLYDIYREAEQDDFDKLVEVWKLDEEGQFSVMKLITGLTEYFFCKYPDSFDYHMDLVNAINSLNNLSSEKNRQIWLHNMTAYEHNILIK